MTSKQFTRQSPARQWRCDSLLWSLPSQKRELTPAPPRLLRERAAPPPPAALTPVADLPKGTGSCHQTAAAQHLGTAGASGALPPCRANVR